jgi:hypothetical protein
MMTLVRAPLRSTALFAALLSFLPTTSFGAPAQPSLVDQVCAGVQSAPACPTSNIANAAEMTSWLVGLAKLGDVATLAAAMDKPQQFGIGQGDSLAGFCLVRDPKDRLLVLYGVAEHSRRPLISFLRDTRAKTGPSDLSPAQAAANRKASVERLQKMVLPGLCASARTAGASERTTAALAAALLTRKLIAEAQAVEESRGSETAEVNHEQFRKMVEDQLLCEAKREADVGSADGCKFGGQIQSAILADVDLIAQKVRRLKRDIETSASELDERYGAWNAVERMLRTYAQVLSDRQQGGGDPEQLAFDEALRNLRSAFEDRQLLAQASGEASVWVNDNGPSRGTLTCANADAANYPVCRTKGRDRQPLFSCPAEAINETNIEKWLICLHSEGMNSVRAAKDAGLPAGDLPRGIRQQFLDWLWSVDVIAAIAAENVLEPRAAK